MKPISFSAYKRYHTCPKFYEYYDIQKIKLGQKTSALIFGSIIDESLNELLRGNEIKARDLLILNCLEAIDDECLFYPGDYDKDLVDTRVLTQFAEATGWKGSDFNELIKILMDNQETISKKQRLVLNTTIWNSLMEKGIIIIDSYIREVLPLMDTVHDIQKKLVYQGKSGQINGILDFTCTLKDGRKVLFDNKTTKMFFDRDSVLTSPQLALYSTMDNFDHAGFIAINKQIKKNRTKICNECKFDGSGGKHKTCYNKIDGARCDGEWTETIKPEANIQVIIDKIPQRNKDLVMDAIDDTMKCIKQGTFPRNLDTCKYIYGKPCPYIDLCWTGKLKEKK